MKHGSQFKDLLDPRDRVLEHDFTFRVNLDPEVQGKTFLESQAYQTILKKVH